MPKIFILNQPNRSGSSKAYRTPTERLFNLCCSTCLLCLKPQVEHFSAGQKLGGFGGSLAAKPKPGAHLKELGHILRELAPSL